MSQNQREVQINHVEFLPEHLQQYADKIGRIFEEELGTLGYFWHVGFDDGTSDVFSVLDFEYIDELPSTDPGLVAFWLNCISGKGN